MKKGRKISYTERRIICEECNFKEDLRSYLMISVNHSKKQIDYVLQNVNDQSLVTVSKFI